MNAEAYLAGVLHGDGWCSEATIGLHVKDKDFAETFAVALELVFGCTARPRKDGLYWRVTARNDSGRFTALREYEPSDVGERAAWVRGLFDSEGNTYLRPLRAGPGCWDRRVAMYSTAMPTLERAKSYLDEIGIPAVIRAQRASASHMGTLQVYELKLAHSREAFLRFAWMVGSSIGRKRNVLLAIPLSYQSDPVASMRSAQRLGAAAKHRKTMEVTLPRVVEGMRLLIAQGVKPTQRACAAIQGFETVRSHVRMAELVALASA